MATTPIPGPVPAKRKKVVMMRRKDDDTIHACLFEAVGYARAHGYELIDPIEYQEQKKLRDGCHVAEGETIAPETAKFKGVKRTAPGESQAKSQEAATVPGETRFIPFA